MPTPLDRALSSRHAFLGFAGIIGVVAAWSIWGGGDMFPKESLPTGDPKNWTETQMRRWLDARQLETTGQESRGELLVRVEAAMRAPKS